MLKKNFCCVLWLGILNLPLALYFANSYAPSIEESPWFALSTFACAATGHFFLYFFLASLILIFPFFGFASKIGKWRLTWALVVISLLHIILATDAQVFALYRFHINYAMLDLFFNGGGEVISLSMDMWIDIGIKVALIIVYSLVVLGFAFLLAYKGIKVRLLVLLALLMYVLANLTHAYGSAKQLLPVLEIQNRLPFYKPLTMNSLLLKLGVITPEDLSARKVQIGQNERGLFDYPKNKLTYFDHPQEPYNVLLVAVDSLRYDMLTQEVMPHTYAFSQQAIRFNNHYSSSNATRGGIFGLFYGLPPSYWTVALTSGIPSIVTQVVQERGYQYGIFTSANLIKPEFNATVFAAVPNLRLESRGTHVLERDAAAIEDFEAFLQKLRRGDKFFSFIFLDNVHSYAYPEVGSTMGHADITAEHNEYEVFKPTAKTLNQMEYSNDLDPTPIINRYKNAAHYADINVKTILDLLESYGYSENTIVIITSDHGEEFNDNKDNYWGHNSNFTDVQMKIPFVVKWPHRVPHEVNALTSAYDVSATLLHHVFGVKNPIRDYSIGADLFHLPERSYVLVGSYLENAIIESDRIVLIDKFGMLQYKDKRYRSIANDSSRPSHLFEVLKTMSYYLQGAEGDSAEATEETEATSEASVDAAAGVESTEAAESALDGATVSDGASIDTLGGELPAMSANADNISSSDEEAENAVVYADNAEVVQGTAEAGAASAAVTAEDAQ